MIRITDELYHELISNKESLDYENMVQEIGLLTFLGWKITIQRNESLSTYEVVANYKHFFKSRKFIEQDPFYDYAIDRMIKRIYQVMEEYKWQYPKYKEYLHEKRLYEQSKEEEYAVSDWDSDSTGRWVLDRQGDDTSEDNESD
jgi:hypothetical protein